MDTQAGKASTEFAFTQDCLLRANNLGQPEAGKAVAKAGCGTKSASVKRALSGPRFRFSARSLPSCRVEIFRSQIGVALEHFPILVARDKRYLFDGQPSLEQSASRFMSQIMKMQIFNFKGSTGATEGSSD